MTLDAYRQVWVKIDEALKHRDILTTTDPARVTGRYAHQTAEVMTRHVQPGTLRDYTVLEYGCGTGRLARLVAPRCQWFICADIVPDIVVECESRLAGFSNCGYLVVDGTSLTPDRKVDFIYSFASIHYFNRAEEFWDSVELIDATAEEFCLHLSRHFNEDTDPARAIEHTPITENLGDCPTDFFNLTSCYRPSPETVKQRYPSDRYQIEWHEPDVRGSEPFFYKLPAR